MLVEIIIHGVGGQGALTAGQLLISAGLAQGYAVSLVPYYLPEVRGGEANAIAVISSQPIGSVLPAQWDASVLLAQRSARRFAAETKPGGLVLYNSTLVERPEVEEGIEVVGVAASEVADQLGDIRVANLVMLGALCACRPFISLGALRESLQATLTGKKAKFVPLNLDAIEAGAKAVAPALRV